MVVMGIIIVLAEKALPNFEPPLLLLLSVV